MGTLNLSAKEESKESMLFYHLMSLLIIMRTVSTRFFVVETKDEHIVKNDMQNAINSPDEDMFQEVKKGGVDYAIEDEISGGVPALSHEFPWMVRIAGQGCLIGICGGALISPRLVLTAFHCTRDKSISFYKPCDHSDGKRVAVLGQPNINDTSSRVEIPIIHVFYPEHAGLHSDMGNIEDHDFAMVLLKTPVKYSRYMKPICLPKQGQEFSGETVTAAGWGSFTFWVDKKVRLSPELRKVNLTVSSKKYAHYKMFGTELRKNKKGEYMDPCAGDSGGPLMKMLAPGKAIIVGTVSGTGYSCIKDRVAKVEGSDNGLWNKVSVWVDWITNIMKTLHEQEPDKCASGE